jgi:quercetin dioxygenase-like cupin family protein
MKLRLNIFPALAFAIVAFFAGWVLGDFHADPLPSAVISEVDAGRESAAWGTFLLYFNQETYGTKDVVAGVAVINPGMEIHPPHVHAEEEYLLVTEGTGTWHLNGEEFPANAGDMLYASPWDVHGISNSGADTLRFVVWKWNSKGMAIPAASTR